MAHQSKRDWENARLAGEAARGLYSPDSNAARYLAGQPMAKNAKSSFDKLNQQLNRNLNAEINKAAGEKGPSRDQIDKAAKAGKRLEFSGTSDCFDELSWRNGIVTAVFWNGYEYSAELDKETFLDWTSDSAGKFFNQVLGKDFFA